MLVIDGKEHQSEFNGGFYLKTKSMALRSIYATAIARAASLSIFMLCRKDFSFPVARIPSVFMMTNKIANMTANEAVCIESKSVSAVVEGTAASTTYLLLITANNAAHGSEILESVLGFIKNARTEINMDMYTHAVNLKNVIHGFTRLIVTSAQSLEYIPEPPSSISGFPKFVL